MTTIALDDATLAKLRAAGSNIVTVANENGDILGQIRLFEEPDPVCIVDRSDTDKSTADARQLSH